MTMLCRNHIQIISKILPQFCLPKYQINLTNAQKIAISKGELIITLGFIFWEKPAYEKFGVLIADILAGTKKHFFCTKRFNKITIDNTQLEKISFTDNIVFLLFSIFITLSKKKGDKASKISILKYPTLFSDLELKFI